MSTYTLFRVNQGFYSLGEGSETIQKGKVIGQRLLRCSISRRGILGAMVLSVVGSCFPVPEQALRAERGQHRSAVSDL